MKNILCVKWGNKYDSYVEKLKNQIDNNCTCEYKFYCLTDNPKHPYDIKLPTLWDEHYNPEKNHFWAYRKLYMFNEELFPELDGDEFLFFDLDVLIHNSINPFFNLEMDKPWIIRGWWNNIETCILNYGKGISPLTNSSVIRWNRGQLKHVYDHVQKNTKFIFFTYKSLDNYINHHWYDIFEDRSDTFNVFEKGLIYSWYKGNIYSSDMETKKLRNDHIVCLFNNSAETNEHMYDIREIKKLWNQ
jgi:hypothetical protein